MQIKLNNFFRVSENVKRKLREVGSSVLAWLDGSTASSAVSDSIGNINSVTYSSCFNLTVGASDTISVSGLTASNVVTLGTGSTSTPTAGTDVITFTAGTINGIYIDGEIVYPCAEGSDIEYTLYSVSDSWDDATINPVSLTLANIRTQSGIIPWNIYLGYTQYRMSVTDGGQKFLIGHSMYSESGIKFRGRWRGTSLMGTGRTLDSNACAFGRVADDKWRLLYADSDNYTDIGTADDKWHTIEINKNGQLYIDDVLTIDVGDISFSTINGNGDFAINGWYRLDDYAAKDIDIAWIERYENDVLQNRWIADPDNPDGYIDVENNNAPLTNTGTASYQAFIPGKTISTDASGDNLQSDGGYIHNNAEPELTFPSSVGNLSDTTIDYDQMYLDASGTRTDSDNWHFSHNDNNQIVDGRYFNPALTGDELTAEYAYLDSKHS